MKSLVPIFVEGRKLPWKVDLSAATTGTRRVRVFLAKEEEALRFIITFRERGLTAAQLSISEGYVSTDGQPQGATVKECWALWLTRSAKLDPKTQAQYRYIGRLFMAKHGSHPVSAISHRDVDAWLKSLSEMSETTVFNCYRITNRFFEYCREWLEIIPRNPLAKIEMEKPSGKKEVLTPDEMKIALRVALESDDLSIVLWLALGGFCGLRTSECLRMKWEDFDWDGLELHVVPKKVRGGLRERFVHLMPAAVEILKPMSQPAGRVISLNASNFQIHRDRFLEKMREVDPARWASWPDNSLRHSAATYHLADNQDAGSLAQFLGHTNPQTSHKEYARAAKRVNGAAWWAIRIDRHQLNKAA